MIDFDKLFEPQEMDEQQKRAADLIRGACKNAAMVINHRAPHCPDTTAAVRRIAEGCMTAVRAVATKGRAM